MQETKDGNMTFGVQRQTGTDSELTFCEVMFSFISPFFPSFLVTPKETFHKSVKTLNADTRRDANARGDGIDMYGDSRKNLLEILAVVMILSRISSVRGSVCVTSLLLMWGMTHMWDMAHSCVWHDLFIYGA